MLTSLVVVVMDKLAYSMNKFLIGFKYELVVVVPANCKGNNISALQVQNSAEIGFLAPGTIFHFCNIGTPLLIYRVSCEFSVQNILGSCFRSASPVSRAFSADDGQQADNMYSESEDM